MFGHLFICDCLSSLILCSAAEVEPIIITDEDDATVRTLQMEEDEALARNLQVKAFTFSLRHGSFVNLTAVFGCSGSV